MTIWASICGEECPTRLWECGFSQHIPKLGCHLNDILRAIFVQIYYGTQYILMSLLAKRITVDKVLHRMSVWIFHKVDFSFRKCCILGRDFFRQVHTNIYARHFSIANFAIEKCLACIYMTLITKGMPSPVVLFELGATEDLPGTHRVAGPCAHTSSASTTTNDELCLTTIIDTMYATTFEPKTLTLFLFLLHIRDNECSYNLF